MAVDHPGRGADVELVRTMRKIARQTFQNSSIGRAGIRVYDGGWIRIEDGGLQVTGIASVSGRLEGDGTFDWSGPMNLTGDQTVTGDVTYTGQLIVYGPWKLVGNGQITGDVSVTGDIEILSGGRIKVGDMIIDPTDGGSVTLPNGAVVQADGSGGVQMRQGANKVFVGPGLVSLQYGSRSWGITASSHRIGGANTTPSSLAGGAAVGSLWSTESGEVSRVVSG